MEDTLRTLLIMGPPPSEQVGGYLTLTGKRRYPDHEVQRSSRGHTNHPSR